MTLEKLISMAKGSKSMSLDPADLIVAAFDQCNFGAETAAAHAATSPDVPAPITTILYFPFVVGFTQFLG